MRSFGVVVVFAAVATAPRRMPWRKAGRFAPSVATARSPVPVSCPAQMPPREIACAHWNRLVVSGARPASSSRFTASCCSWLKISTFRIEPWTEFAGSALM